MKYTIGFFLLLFGMSAFASQCRVNGGQWKSMPSNNSLDIKVHVQLSASSKRIMLEGYSLECRFSRDSGLPSSARDFWHTTMGGIVPGPKLAGYNIGLNIRSADYNAPVPEILLATLYNYDMAANLNTYMYIITRGSPGSPINIETNDLLGTIQLRQTNNTGKPPVPLVRINLIANNRLVIEPSTCTINGNYPITVDFSNVDRTRIGESVSNTPIRKAVRLNYSCPDPGITLPIKITMKGYSASFSRDVLYMSNPNVGTGLLRNGALVRPEGWFNTYISNSGGGDNLEFVLVRKPGSVPSTGAFTGSATLVMGLP